MNVEEFDQSLTQWINGLSGQSIVLDQFFIAAASFGVPAIVILVVGRWWRIGSITSLRYSCVVAGLSFLLALGINLVVTALVHRVRPNDAGFTHLIISANPDWSFPSDHAAVASAVVSGVFFSGGRRFAAILAAVAAIVSFSRVYVGVHYVSDVLGGLVIGTTAGYMVSRAFGENNRIAQRLVRIL